MFQPNFYYGQQGGCGQSAWNQTRNNMPYYYGVNPMTMPPPVSNGSMISPTGTVFPGTAGREESYVENILRLNRGKIATFYMTYENNKEWNAKVFRGRIEAAGRDHIIISDPETGVRHLLLMLNLDYVTFDEPVAYEYPFHGSVVTEETPIQSR